MYVSSIYWIFLFVALGMRKFLAHTFIDNNLFFFMKKFCELNNNWCNRLVHIFSVVAMRYFDLDQFYRHLIAFREIIHRIWRLPFMVRHNSKSMDKNPNLWIAIYQKEKKNQLKIGEENALVELLDLGNEVITYIFNVTINLVWRWNCWKYQFWSNDGFNHIYSFHFVK